MSSNASPATGVYLPLTLFCVWLILGIVAQDWLDAPRWTLGLGLLVTLVAWRTAVGSSVRIALPLLIAMVLIAGGLIHSFCRQGNHDERLTAWLPEKPQPVVMEATVLELPQRVRREPQPWHRETVWKYRVRLHRLRTVNGWANAAGRLEVWHSSDDLSLLPGDHCRFSGEISLPPPQRNPGGPDRRRQLARQGIIGRLSVGPSGSPDVVGRSSAFPFRGFAIWRRTADERLARHLDGPAYALARALALGLRDELDEDTVELFQEAGIGHLLAISGFHVGLLFALLVVPASRIGFSRGAVRTTAILVVVLYVGLSGMRPSVLRAAVCVLMVLLAQSRGRPVGVISLLSLAAIGLFVSDSSHCFDVGTQLSFLGVYLLSRSGMRGPSDEQQWIRRRVLSRSSWASRAVVATLVAYTRLQWATLLVLLGTTPLVAHTFHRTAWAALLVNPLVVAPTSLLLGSSLLLMIPGVGDVLGPVLVLAIELSVHAILALAEWGRELIPPRSTTGPRMGELVAGYAILFLADRFDHVGWNTRGWRRRWPVAGSLLPLSLMPREQASRSQSPPARASEVQSLTSHSSTVQQDRQRRPGPKAILAWLLIWNLLLIFEPMWVALVASSQRSREASCVTVIDVGHGTSILLENLAGETWLYDAGSSSGGTSAARTISGVLWARRVGRLDRVLLSHPDRDHFNGLVHLLDRHEVGCVVIPRAFAQHSDIQWQRLLNECRARQIPIQLCAAGDSLLESSAARVQVLHPPGEGETTDDNQASLVLDLEIQGCRWLVTGDVEGDAGISLAEQVTDCDVLVAPHHGGRDSSPERWIRNTRPQWVCVSAAHECPWLENRDMTAEVLNTSQTGAIQFQIDERGCRVSTWLTQEAGTSGRVLTWGQESTQPQRR